MKSILLISTVLVTVGMLSLLSPLEIFPSSHAQILYSSNYSPLTISNFEIYNLNTKQVTYNIPFYIETGTINEIIPYCDSHSIVIRVTSNESGELVIDIPRNLLDVKYQNHDDNFFVLLDGEEINFKEIRHAQSREYIISVTPDSYEIEIIGSFYLSYGIENIQCEIVHNPPYAYILPPLKQIRNNVTTEDVICEPNLTKTYKFSNGQPLCVKPSSIPILSDRNYIIESGNQIITYSPVLFSGTGTSVSGDDLVIFLKEKRETLDIAFDELREKGLYPITGKSFSIGNNAYFLDEQYAGTPIALEIDVLKDEFTKDTLEKIDSLVRKYVGNEIDIVYSKGGYAIPANED